MTLVRNACDNTGNPVATGEGGPSLAWTVVSKEADGTVVYDPAGAFQGTDSLHVVAASPAAVVLQKSFPGAGSVACSWYFRLNALVSADVQLLQIYDSNALKAASVDLSSSNRIRLTIRRIGNFVNTGTTTLQAGVWYRADFRLVKGAQGLIALQVFRGNETSNPVYSHQAVDDAGELDFTQARWGKPNGAGSLDVNLDGIQVDDGRSSFIGVYSNVTPLSVTATTNLGTVRAGQPVTLTAAGAGGAGTRTYAWERVSPLAGTFSNGGAGASVTYTPQVLGTHTLRVTVTDGQGAATKNVTVQVTAAPEPLPFAALTASSSVLKVGDEPLADNDEGTFLQLPAGGTVTLALPRLEKPDGDLTVILRDSLRSIPSGRLTAVLLNGTSTVSTATASPPATGQDPADRTFTFAGLAGVSAVLWDAGTVTVRVTAQGG